MSTDEMLVTAAAVSEFTDHFADDRAQGQVIGSSGPGGMPRLGVDREGIIAIDHGALRIRPLLQPGWGRAGIAFGPFPRTPGMLMAVRLLNGHNTSQSGAIERLPKRLYRWIIGGGHEALPSRLPALLRMCLRPTMLRQLAGWVRTSPFWHRRLQPQDIDENLALGWFSSPVPDAPLADGHCLAMHATGANNGELWVRSAGTVSPRVSGFQNLPFAVAVVLRERGAAYYLASLPGAYGAAAWPAMRPLAIDPAGTQATMYAGLQQSVLGQIGFRVDTRVHAVHVGQYPQLANWYGTAHAAEAGLGSGRLHQSEAECGGFWQATPHLQRSADGVIGTADSGVALLFPAQPSGLIHVLADLPAAAEAGIIWRAIDNDNCWGFFVAATGWSLRVCRNGDWRVLTTGPDLPVASAAVRSLQVLDDGTSISCFLDGVVVIADYPTQAPPADATGVGIALRGVARLTHFEAHPKMVELPCAVELGPLNYPQGRAVVIDDDFSGPPGELAGQSIGMASWQRTIGVGRLLRTGSAGVRADATVERPNPNRTAYTIPWDSGECADLEATIMPPGTARGQGERGRAGLIFWQDPNNYLIVSTWLDDAYDGTSISSFFSIDGVEDIYDAVWTNVGRRVTWGQPYRLRATFDGLLYTAWVDDEPVLQRSLIDVYPEVAGLVIRRVGIVVNWEWGDDTGSTFLRFTARSQE